jgi:PKD repeat protein
MQSPICFRLAAAALLVAAGTMSFSAVAAQPRVSVVASVPRPDHVVIVVEENHSDADIVGNPDAPYINSLAATGATFTQSFAETHPSQPNYLALFSGSTQGITDDSCPNTFSAASLGSELLGAGLGFAGYSDGLPSVGYTGCKSGSYARKHVPWVNFSNVPASANQPFYAFPSDYATLPEVSFVIPNLDNDMHDGSIAQGDQWLEDNLGDYVAWAQTHNSVFVLTFDEAEGGQPNRVPTVITGDGVASGAYSETINHYSVLRTIQDAYGLAPLGASAAASPILDIWTPATGDRPPVADFTSSCDVLACIFDGSLSSDPDGTLQSYRWAFGDGSAETSSMPTHTYAVGGTYAVDLTVTDDQGASSSVTHSVSVATPAGLPFVFDSFDRTVSGGFGSADLGGQWSTVGAADDFSVAPGMASSLMPTAPSLREAFVGTAQTDADLALTFRADKAPEDGPIFLSVEPRRVSSDTTYAARLIIYASGWTAIRLVRVVDGTTRMLAPPVHVEGLSYTSGTALSVRVQATGTEPTMLRARAWPAASSEPSDWQVTASDSAPGLQVGGVVGFSAYLGQLVTNAPIVLGFSSFVASAPAAVQPPVAQSN